MIPKTIDCNAPILFLNFIHNIPDCAAVGIGVTFDNVQISADGVLTAEESLTHNFGLGETASCELQFEVCVGEADDGGFVGGCAGPKQLIVVTDANPTVNHVGGMLLLPDTTALFLSYGIANAIWLVPTLAGIGAGIYLTKSKLKL